MENFIAVFKPTLFQMFILLIFIATGFILRKKNVIGDGAIGVLSKLVTTLFLPAVLLGTFLKSFTIDNLSSYGVVIAFSAIVSSVCIVIGMVCGKILGKGDDFIKKAYQYSLIYSNFSYIGIPLVKALAPQFEVYYLVFTIIPQFTFVLWSLPFLLIPKKEGVEEVQEKQSFGKIILSYLKKLLNPIFIGLFLGVILGITGAGKFLQENENTKFIVSVIDQAGACMSVSAMLLTGVVVAKYDIIKAIKDYKVYIATALRLIVIPLVLGFTLMGACKLFNIEGDTANMLMWCLMCFVAMPLGLNTVIIPSAYGKDTSVPAGMALVSHVLGVVTIPIIMAIFVTI